MKKIINKFESWSESFVGDIVITGTIIVIGLVLAWGLSWALWICGIWG